ncbi:hypothetical protein GCM10017744_102480 [Streptomyces antimycoticus]|uniref:Uncharacterized protein n=1 Tax=Streptomyces antimycoticus TaxID=68175 RepID=A0A4D4KJF5_9ACTN|nr:hypothetical protein [Streptomyces antimycoticus]GDY49281.1 hypothetical protein SANT12839_101630 [Streptomyces antimycoticus]
MHETRGRNPDARRDVPGDMDTDLINTAASAAGAVALLFLGAWENDRRTRRTEARKEAAADRAALEAQADELVAAVLAVKVAGNAHDHLWGGWRARATVAMQAAVRGGAGYVRSGQRGFPAVLAGYGDAARVIGQWDQESAASAAGLAAPLSRLGAAAAPLLRRSEPGLAAAVDEVFTAVADNYADEDRTTRALEAFHEALRPALEPRTVRRHRWAPRWGSSR